MVCFSIINSKIERNVMYATFKEKNNQIMALVPTYFKCNSKFYRNGPDSKNSVKRISHSSQKVICFETLSWQPKPKFLISIKVLSFVSLLKTLKILHKRKCKS